MSRVRRFDVVIYRVVRPYLNPIKLDYVAYDTICRSLPVKVFNDAAPRVTDAPLPKIEEEERKSQSTLCCFYFI
ncbi:hypothetical protein PS15p_210513 [Mucor circinelloides]